jgi:hypothetical protein
LKTEKANVIYVSTIDELYEKVKHARRGTNYVLLDDSKRLPMVSFSDLMKEIRMMEFLISIMRIQDVEYSGAILFRKYEKKRRGLNGREKSCRTDK